MKVALLTEQQRNKLIGKKYNEHFTFNPILDDNDNYIITIDEVDATDVDEFAWVKSLPLIDFVPNRKRIPTNG
jgi:hypothetical protein